MAEQDQGTGAEVLERGNIYFFYRPAVGAESPGGLVDVQRVAAEPDAIVEELEGRVEGGARLG